MLPDSSSEPRSWWDHSRWLAVLYPIGVVAAFYLSAVITGLGLRFLEYVGLVKFGAGSEAAVAEAVIAALIYIVTIALVVGLPWVNKKLVHLRATAKDLGYGRWMSWTDILLGPAGFLVYIVLSALLVYVGSLVIGFNTTQTQDVGFQGLQTYTQYVLAFITLVVMAPIAEETLFRGYLYDKVKKYVPTWLAIIITSVTFGLVHGQWNVGLDVFALSIVLCLLREISGSIWPSIWLHMLKNGIAFYILFISPMILHTLGG
jgi:membrane protease YdiL (CAAX protease family)